MRKEISTIILLAILIIAVLGLASAITIYSGESYSFESEEFEYYTVVGNSSNMEGMNISWENGNTTINFAYNYAPDNFTLIFFNLEKEIITEHHYSSGGGTKYVDRNVTEYVEVPNYIDREVEVIKEIQSEPEIIKEKESVWIKIIYILGGFLIGFWSIIIVMKLILRSKRRNEVRNDSQLV